MGAAPRILILDGEVPLVDALTQVQAWSRRTHKGKRGWPLPATPALFMRTWLQVHIVQVVRRLSRGVVRVGGAVAGAGEHARVAGDAPLVHRRVGVDVALRGGHEARGGGGGAPP